MTLYRVSWSQTEYRSALIEAASEEEAVQMAREGSYDDSDFDMCEGFDLVDAEEVA
jgi:hypothetical protein